MTDIELTNRSIQLDPDLDLENVHELPGKDIMQAALRQFGETAKCSSLIQDSHGWCFYVHADDGRKYLVELGYASTENGASTWFLSCARYAGWRLWEAFGSRAPVGREQALLDRGVAFLISKFGYERAVN